MTPYPAGSTTQPLSHYSPLLVGVDDCSPELVKGKCAGFATIIIGAFWPVIVVLRPKGCFTCRIGWLIWRLDSGLKAKQFWRWTNQPQKRPKNIKIVNPQNIKIVNPKISRWSTHAWWLLMFVIFPANPWAASLITSGALVQDWPGRPFLGSRWCHRSDTVRLPEAK